MTELKSNPKVINEKNKDDANKIISIENPFKKEDINNNVFDNRMKFEEEKKKFKKKSTGKFNSMINFSNDFDPVLPENNDKSDTFIDLNILDDNNNIFLEDNIFDRLDNDDPLNFLQVDFFSRNYERDYIKPKSYNRINISNNNIKDENFNDILKSNDYEKFLNIDHITKNKNNNNSFCYEKAERAFSNLSIKEKIFILFKKSDKFKKKQANNINRNNNNKTKKFNLLDKKYFKKKREVRILADDSLDKKINIKIKQKLQAILDFFFFKYCKQIKANKQKQKHKEPVQVFLTNLNKSLKISALKKLHKMKIKEVILKFSKLRTEEISKNLINFLNEGSQKFRFKFFEEFLNLNFENFLDFYFKKYLVRDLIELKELYQNNLLIENYIKRVIVRRSLLDNPRIYGNKKRLSLGKSRNKNQCYEKKEIKKKFFVVIRSDDIKNDKNLITQNLNQDYYDD